MRTYNKYIASVAALLATAVSVEAQTVTDAVMQRYADKMAVEMNFDFEEMDVHENRAVVVTPVIENGERSLKLSPVGLYGRTRWYQYLRAGEKPLGGADETSFRSSKRPSTYGYSSTVPYEEWMNGAELKLLREEYGCCRSRLNGAESDALAYYKEVYFRPAMRYVSPAAEAVKMRELSGRAYIDFPVNRTDIHVDYRNNSAELAKIIATIDSVRNDKDVTVSSLGIKGFASPEGSYANNERLAKGRTEALRQYVQNLYKFAPGFITTSYEPEDWEGLRAAVEASGLENREAILALIGDTSLQPDAREAQIKSRFPSQYKFMLDTYYPALRHSDYTIEYSIRSFSDAAEILEIMRTQPQKLSLNEMYLVAQTLEPGSEAFNEVFETAVRMYPDDEAANLNAANAAMLSNNLPAAERYLSKAGESGEVTYARGMLAALKGDYAKAAELVRESGLPDVDGMIEHLREAEKYAPRK